MIVYVDVVTDSEKRGIDMGGKEEFLHFRLAVLYLDL